MAAKANEHLHGRNTATWNIKGATVASDRFNYDYGAGELGDVAGQLAQLSSKVGTAHAVFNNNMEDQGQRNAGTLQALMREMGLG